MYGHNAMNDRIIVGFVGFHVSKVRGGGLIGVGMNMFNKNVDQPCMLERMFENADRDGQIVMEYNDGCMFV